MGLRAPTFTGCSCMRASILFGVKSRQLVCQI